MYRNYRVEHSIGNRADGLPQSHFRHKVFKPFQSRRSSWTSGTKFSAISYEVVDNKWSHLVRSLRPSGTKFADIWYEVRAWMDVEGVEAIWYEVRGHLVRSRRQDVASSGTKFAAIWYEVRGHLVQSPRCGVIWYEVRGHLVRSSRTSGTKSAPAWMWKS